MAEPLVCMTLTGKTLDEDLRLIQKYHKQVDLVELRADCLNEDEQLYIKRFPSLCHLPSILTIRRNIDGGFFNGGEFSRTNLFASNAAPQYDFPLNLLASSTACLPYSLHCSK